jgi:hypothetical protein
VRSGWSSSARRAASTTSGSVVPEDSEAGVSTTTALVILRSKATENLAVEHALQACGLDSPLRFTPLRMTTGGEVRL